jgi:hypothetical protein
VLNDGKVSFSWLAFTMNGPGWTWIFSSAPLESVKPGSNAEDAEVFAEGVEGI